MAAQRIFKNTVKTKGFHSKRLQISDEKRSEIIVIMTFPTVGENVFKKKHVELL